LFAAVFWWRRKFYAEAVFCAAAILIRWFSTSWSLPRFTLFMFPVFILLFKLRRYPWIWYAYLFIGIWYQAFLVRNYVLAWPPAP
jgi:hypothetical protein